MTENNTPKQFRHGDLLIEEDTMPDEAELVNVEDLVLEYGERTGHKHQIKRKAGKDGKVKTAGKDATVVKMTKLKGRRVGPPIKYLKVGPEGATLIHEEHGPIEIPPGQYRVQRQREYDPVRGSRTVVD